MRYLRPRWVVTLEHGASGTLLIGTTSRPFIFRHRAISHCNWRNCRRRIAGARWVVVDRRSA